MTYTIGQTMAFFGINQQKSELRYIYRVHLYQAKNCKEYPMRGRCHKSNTDRIIQLNHQLIKYRKQERKSLLSDERKSSTLIFTFLRVHLIFDQAHHLEYPLQCQQ